MATLVHSFWSRPSLIPRYGYKSEQLFLNLWYFSLSCAYAKSIGAPIVLHTDTLGARLYGHLPYDNIYTTLDAVEAPPRFWAAGKFYALQAEQDARAIHIDGDVFIKQGELWERMANSKADILVQFREPWISESGVKKLKPYINDDYIAHNSMYNTGVLGVFNNELKDKVLNTYFSAIKCAKQIPSATLNDQYFTPDLVCEQQMIAYKSIGYNVDMILSSSYKCTDEADSIGYQHVQSSSKYKDVDKCKRALKQINYNIYIETKKLCMGI